jgi:hypothetical protein
VAIRIKKAEVVSTEKVDNRASRMTVSIVAAVVVVVADAVAMTVI